MKFESHNKFLDIQYLIEDEEIIADAGRAGMAEKAPYSEERECTHYDDPAVYSNVLIRAGEFVLLGIEEAHKPRCMAIAPMAVKKIVVKVPV